MLIKNTSIFLSSQFGRDLDRIIQFYMFFLLFFPFAFVWANQFHRKNIMIDFIYDSYSRQKVSLFRSLSSCSTWGRNELEGKDREKKTWKKKQKKAKKKSIGLDDFSSGLRKRYLRVMSKKEGLKLKTLIFADEQKKMFAFKSANLYFELDGEKRVFF